MSAQSEPTNTSTTPSSTYSWSSSRVAQRVTQSREAPVDSLVDNISLLMKHHHHLISQLHQFREDFTQLYRAPLEAHHDDTINPHAITSTAATTPNNSSSIGSTLTRQANPISKFFEEKLYAVVMELRACDHLIKKIEERRRNVPKNFARADQSIRSTRAQHTNLKRKRDQLERDSIESEIKEWKRLCDESRHSTTGKESTTQTFNTKNSITTTTHERDPRARFLPYLSLTSSQSPSVRFPKGFNISKFTQFETKKNIGEILDNLKKHTQFQKTIIHYIESENLISFQCHPLFVFYVHLSESSGDVLEDDFATEGKVKGEKDRLFIDHITVLGVDESIQHSHVSKYTLFRNLQHFSLEAYRYYLYQESMVPTANGTDDEQSQITPIVQIMLFYFTSYRELCVGKCTRRNEHMTLNGFMPADLRTFDQCQAVFSRPSSF